MKIFENLNSITMFFNKSLGRAQRHEGFTLAEVLITISIIGIVAAMTIPTLVRNVQEAETRTGLKKAYTVLSQAIKMISTDNGGTLAGICADYDNICFKNVLKQSLKTTKDCDNQVVTKGCWPLATSMDGTAIGSALDAAQYSSLVLLDGMMIGVDWVSSNCTYSDANSTNWKCGRIDVDINGFKKPNRWGKDIFTFSVQDGTIKPLGIAGDSGEFGTCTGSETGLYSGWGCTYKYLYP